MAELVADSTKYIYYFYSLQTEIFSRVYRIENWNSTDVVLKAKERNKKKIESRIVCESTEERNEDVFAQLRPYDIYTVLLVAHSLCLCCVAWEIFTWHMMKREKIKRNGKKYFGILCKIDDLSAFFITLRNYALWMGSMRGFLRRKTLLIFGWFKGNAFFSGGNQRLLDSCCLW